ncbi:MAG: hypothetical protein D6826_03055 [Alphaproteobacteria bacterium]|nr:MAG: hypothetical protein D6826_03055 [Alphaproteobacteria bacterium]
MADSDEQAHAYQARAAALSLAHGSSLARLLRAHGRDALARQVEGAIEEAYRIVADEVGREALSAAVRWIAERTEPGAGTRAAASLRH